MNFATSNCSIKEIDEIKRKCLVKRFELDDAASSLDIALLNLESAKKSLKKASREKISKYAKYYLSKIMGLN